MNLTLLTEPEYSNRLGEIMLYNKLGCDNEIKVYYSIPVLDKVGIIFNVNPPRKKRSKMKYGNCYGNAILRMSDGFEYVEGIITNKETGFQISHAWNIDSKGNHIDFTIIDTQKYKYKGVVISKKLLYEIGKKNGGLWYCSLPYIISEE